VLFGTTLFFCCCCWTVLFCVGHGAFAHSFNQGVNKWKNWKNACLASSAGDLFWDGQVLTLSKVKWPTQRSGILKRSRIESHGGKISPVDHTSRVLISNELDQFVVTPAKLWPLNVHGRANFGQGQHHDWRFDKKNNPHAADREDMWRLMHVNANLPVYTGEWGRWSAPLYSSFQTLGMMMSTRINAWYVFLPTFYN